MWKLWIKDASSYLLWACDADYELIKAERALACQTLFKETDEFSITYEII